MISFGSLFLKAIGRQQGIYGSSRGVEVEGLTEESHFGSLFLKAKIEP
jgi:hypothetical protein